MLHNYIEKLLQGREIEWKRLGEITNYQQPTPYLVKTTNYNDSFKTPVLTAGKTFILGYTDETDGLYQATENPVIIFDDFTTANKWVDFDFKVKSSAMKIISSVDEEQYLLRYIYHWINTLPNIGKNTDHKRQWISNFSNLKIPIPPLDVQQEIAKTLDRMTNICYELAKELALRDQQYNYYRDRLLNLGELIGGGNQCEWVRLGDIALKITSGGTPNTKKLEYWENGTIPWMSSGEVNLKIIFKTEKFITQKGLENSSAKLIPKNSLVIALAGQGKTRGKVARTRIDLTTNQSLAALIFDEKNINSDYVYYFLTTQYKNLRQISLGNSGRGGLNLQMISDYRIPLLSLDEQERIVKILDKFDRLTNSITEGLPKEIDLRQKQYEYYRDLLLNFDK
ncbi:restriction endonuclease subunit S [Pasteurella atlantica]|uniref:Restriction endonuclease subunit S n=2 Tax=Pasteurellaceae TaxID=712 RepID=A0ACC6HL53_9PAST|nr:restriction endonuclease subunit S [Pasteurella atlantica]MDP8051564.1 restriction endonuclease subunit S [Pasteurella atlantica]MDP8104857.1 restriction endonuclease subunit S [Pasteurella atlantica]MDP8148231.1 restriction endonuclease subunit S [Pasteurella atlantica]